MRLRLTAALLCLVHVGTPAAAEPTPDASVPNASPAHLDNSQCDAYRDSVSAVRTPKDMGTVVLRIEVSAQGEVLRAAIVEHSSTRYFAHVVQENFSKCHFEPARENGIPVAGDAIVRLAFRDQMKSPNDAVCPTPLLRERPPSGGAMVQTRLRVRFTREGRVASVEVLQSSGNATLDEDAVTAYRQCHFNPDAPGQPAFQEEYVTTLNWSS